MINERSILTVSQVNTYVKMLLDSDEILQYVWVRGEISNFTNHYRTGHLYFSLKDADGLIRSVMFRSQAQSLKFVPSDGMKVLARGRVSSFPRDGQYQLYVDEMQPDGMGTLYLAYEQLRRKLEDEGLFDPSKKKPIPPYPRRIGIVTSPTGAVVHDIMTVTARRYPLTELLIYPAQVQGSEAPRQLISGISWFNETGAADVIIIGRGGGSLEDLWAFNHEMLARSVAASKIPVISAVGHESDFTICDFAADLRAATPSAAAELAVPSAYELKRTFDGTLQRLDRSVAEYMEKMRQKLNALSQSRALSAPGHLVEDRRMNLAFLSQKLDVLTDRKLSDERHAFLTVCGKLESLNPIAVLSRGYSAVKTQSGALVKSVHAVSPGDRIRICFHDGEADAVIEGGKEN